jgi:hypothetical protein
MKCLHAVQSEKVTDGSFFDSLNLALWFVRYAEETRERSGQLCQSDSTGSAFVMHNEKSRHFVLRFKVLGERRAVVGRKDGLDAFR